MQSWWLDEISYAGPEHLDPSYVEGYDRKSGFDPSGDIDALVARGLDETSAVVDIGAGTGAFTVAVAPRCGQVLAADVSPAMVRVLRRRVGELGLGNVTPVQAGFLSLDRPPASADVVYTRNALHQLPDFWKAIALQRIHDLLRPGATLLLRDLVFDFEPLDAERRIDDWIAGAVADPAVGFTRDELATHVRTEFSTYSWLLEDMLGRVGFEIVDRAYRRSAYGTYLCRRPPE